MEIPQGFRVASPAQLAVMTALEAGEDAPGLPRPGMSGAEVAKAAAVKLTNVYTLLDRMVEDEAAERRQAGQVAVYRLTARGERVLAATRAAIQAWRSFGFRSRRRGGA